MFVYESPVNSNKRVYISHIPHCISEVEVMRVLLRISETIKIWSVKRMRTWICMTLMASPCLPLWLMKVCRHIHVGITYLDSLILYPPHLWCVLSYEDVCPPRPHLSLPYLAYTSLAPTCPPLSPGHIIHLAAESHTATPHLLTCVLALGMARGCGGVKRDGPGSVLALGEWVGRYGVTSDLNVFAHQLDWASLNPKESVYFWISLYPREIMNILVARCVYVCSGQGTVFYFKKLANWYTTSFIREVSWMNPVWLWSKTGLEAGWNRDSALDRELHWWDVLL